MDTKEFCATSQFFPPYPAVQMHSPVPEISLKNQYKLYPQAHHRIWNALNCIYKVGMFPQSNYQHNYHNWLMTIQFDTDNCHCQWWYHCIFRSLQESESLIYFVSNYQTSAWATKGSIKSRLALITFFAIKVRIANTNSSSLKSTSEKFSQFAPNLITDSIYTTTISTILTTIIIITRTAIWLSPSSFTSTISSSIYS